MRKVFIIILHWNGAVNTLECLKSIRKLEARSWKLEIIVVDNGSREKFRVKGEGLRVENLKIIRNSENLGFAEGNNVGIRHAMNNGADYIVLLNNDTVVDKNLVYELLEATKSNNKVGIIAPKIYFAPNFEFHKDRYNKEELGKVFWYAGGVMDWKNVIASHRGVDKIDNHQFDSIEETDFASGCCIMVKKKVFEEIGLLDSKYFLYYEDSDFCQRVKGKGYKVIYAPKAFLWHKNAGSTGGSGSTLQDYYITRNRLLFAMRYALLRSKLALIKESFRLLISGRPWQKRGVLDFYLKRFGKGSYPI